MKHSLCIPWVSAENQKKCSVLRLLHVGLQKKLVPNMVKRPNAICKDVFIGENRNSRLYTAVSRCGIC